MKKFLLLVIIMFAFPLSVNALDKVTIYFFRGNTCEHCEEALNFINNNKDQIDKRIEIVTYEVWKNENNEKLHQAVAKKLNVSEDEQRSVPFIVVGDSYEIGMLPTISDFQNILDMANKYLSDSEEYEDVVSKTAKELKKEDKKIKFHALTLNQLFNTNNIATAIVLGVFGLLVVGFFGLIIFSRK